MRSSVVMLLVLVLLAGMTVTAFAETTGTPATDKNGNALVSGKQYYMIVVRGTYNPGLISNDILNAERYGITKESWCGTEYPKLDPNGKGIAIQLYLKDQKGVDGLAINRNDQIYMRFAGDSKYFDFPNDDSWGNVWLNSNPSGGVSYLVQGDDNKVNLLTCSAVTWYNGSQGQPGSWPFYNGTSTRTAWFGFRSGTFFNSSKRWLVTNLPAGDVPWTTFKFEPVQ